jgi:hypothetical protein
MGDRRGTYSALMGRTERNKLLGRPRHRWEDHITMDLQEVGGGGMNCTAVAQDRDRWCALVNTIMNLCVP